MSGALLATLWLLVVVAGIGAMSWGSSRAADLLEALRGKYGLPATAGGALMALATAAPETAVNVASVSFGWADLGLGAALGSNVPALPLACLLAYLAARFGKGDEAEPGPDAPPPVVRTEVVEVQVLPYLGVIVLLGLLTLPPAWSGLQPVDGLILVAAWAAFLAYALRRDPWRDRGEPLPEGAVRRAATGLPAIALGAVASVYAAQRVGQAWGWSELVVGLFVIGLLCALPESYSAWRFAREGKASLGIASAAGDGIVSLTVALLPPALVGAAVGNVAVYAINLGFLLWVLGLYALLNRRWAGQKLNLRLVLLLTGSYAVYAALIAWVLIRS